MNTITPLSIQQFEQKLSLVEHTPATIEEYTKEIKTLTVKKTEKRYLNEYDYV